MKHKDFFPLLTEFLGLWHTFKPLQFILFALTILRACCVVLRSLTASSPSTEYFRRLQWVFCASQTLFAALLVYCLAASHS